MVVEAFRAEDKVKSARDVCCLQFLPLLNGSAVLQCLLVVAEGEVLRSEVHRRCHAHGEVGAQTELAQYTDVEAGIPAVLVAGHQSIHAPVLCCYHLRTDICKLDVLQMSAHKHTEVERAQVGIGAVLHGPLLCDGAHGAHHRYN